MTFNTSRFPWLLLAMCLWSCSHDGHVSPHSPDFVGVWKGRHYNPDGPSRNMYMQPAWIVNRRRDGTSSITYYILNNKVMVAMKESASPLEGRWSFKDGILEKSILGNTNVPLKRKAKRINGEIRFVPLTYRSFSPGGLGWSEAAHGNVNSHVIPMGDLQDGKVQYDVELLVDDSIYDYATDYRIVTAEEFADILDAPQ